MTNPKTAEWVNVSDHAVTLDSGQPLAPGETCELALDTDHDKALRDDGHLIKTDDGKEKRT